MDGDAGGVAMGFEHHPLRTLDTLEGTGHWKWLTAQNLQLGPLAEIGSRFIGAAEPRIDQAAVVKGPRIAAAAVDGGRQKVVGLAIIAGEKGVHAPPVKVLQDRVRPPAE
jgi:hypothetical protein